MTSITAKRLSVRTSHSIVALACLAACLPSTKAIAQSEGALPTLDTVEVVGRQQSGQYHAQDSEGATKTDTPLQEVPQAVRVVTRQLVDDLGAQRLDDVLDYVAGVSRQNNFGGMWDNVAMRGFVGHEDMGMSLLRNGMQSNRGFNAPRDTANVERFEFLKGTMGALYGNSEPGGTMNLVTKQPLWKAAHSLETYYGTYGSTRMALDTTGPLNGNASEPATMAYRLNVVKEEQDSFRNFVRIRREMIAPAFTWRLTPDTQLRYDGEFLRQRAPLDRGVLTVNRQVGAVPISRFFGEPSDGDITMQNQTHQFLLDHALSADWSLRAGLQYKRNTMKGLESEAFPFPGGACGSSVETMGWACRRQVSRDFGSQDTSLQLDLTGRFKTGSLEHTLLTGVEFNRFTLDQTMMTHAGGTRYGYGIDIYNPVYGNQPSAPLNVSAINRDVSDRTMAIYVQDQISLTPQWKLLAGVRHDRYRGAITERAVDGAPTTYQQPNATSPRLGLTWLATPQWSLYASAGKTFRAQAQTTYTGAAIPPERGTAYETGAKWQSADQQWGSTIALFDIRKRHMATWDEENEPYLVELPGKVRNRGLEVEVAGRIAAGWRVAMSYTYLNADPLITQFARNSVSAFVTHEMAAAKGGLVGIGGGFTHVGKRDADMDSTVHLPAYTVFKLTSYWNIDRQLRISLDVDNLFNKTYYHSAYNRMWVMPGAPRRITAGLQYKF
ncbi:TonB-dependent siderophore receptor [Comamonas sp. Tr-654]|uniref:TonB-dependent siderophore receptor n=1 Tax=Comamonas sp. Tr-654 TaxID=2608341 RepID=UPI001423A4E9|nr:TonB-dependent siderophore receptor [Comamonas sp. Tr-654]NIF81899.1 TonB-dependent siderophore receptor [Comamonas sp. Tr-654]